MKCKKCGALMKILTYSSLTTCLTNTNQAKRIAYYVCGQCGHNDKLREVFTLSSIEDIAAGRIEEDE